MKNEAPGYVTGYSVCLAGMVIALITSVIFYIGIMKENRDRAAGKAGLLEGEEEDLGDRARSFRYMP